MEQYMSKTRGDYGSGVTKPAINQDTQFEMKGQFLKELHDNTFSGLEHEDANEHIKKVLEIVDLFHEPNESLFRAWERFKELLMECPQHYLTDMHEVILFYNGLDAPTRQILDSKGVIPSKTATDATVAIQEMAEFSQKWHNGTSSRSRSTETSNGLAAIQSQLNNLGREIKKVIEKVRARILPRNNGNSLYHDRRASLEELLTKFMAKSAKRHEENSNIIKEIQASTNAAIRNQGVSVSVMPFSTYTNLGLGILSHTRLTIEMADRTIKQPRGIVENMLVRIAKFIFSIDFIILDIFEDDDVPLILG
nr:hypothetical protein [Tanacetum cinerariifolium]